MSFTNVYYKRTVGTPKACYVCYKPTTTVLATINAVDFIYTCDNHLTDPGFASRLGESQDGAAGTKKPALSAEEIAKVKEEWEERQKRKQEKAKEKEKEKEQQEKGDATSKVNKVKSPTPSQSPSPPSAPTPGTPSSTSSHQKYALHRDVFAMRLGEHRKRKQAAQAKELLPRLPGAPRGSLSPS